MEIRWNENPLLTEVMLTDHEREILAYRVALQNACDDFFSIGYDADKNSADEIGAAVMKAYKRAEDMDGHRKEAAYYAGALASTHIGDCTCDPASCMKCAAEALMNINTISGLGKHEANKVRGAFRDGRSLAEAVDYLRTHDPDDAGPDSWKSKHPEMWADSVPRWREEQRRAYEWLVRYQAEHFAPSPPVRATG